MNEPGFDATNPSAGPPPGAAMRFSAAMPLSCLLGRCRKVDRRGAEHVQKNATARVVLDHEDLPGLD